jgi:uncharacterized lipoprotein YajG
LPKLKVAVLLLVALFMLNACTSKSSTETAVATEDLTVEATASAVASSTPATDECLKCHTDKQHLIDTAAPVVAAESESKGVG